MTQPIYYEDKIKSTNGNWISVLFKGEHHMSADHLEFLPSVPIFGVKRFVTTNGKALFNPQDSCFYIHDSTLIIRINSKTWQATHFISPGKISFGSITQSEDDLNMSLYSTGSGARKPHQLDLKNIEWINGLGPAKKGVFPSAWEPWV